MSRTFVKSFIKEGIDYQFRHPKTRRYMKDNQKAISLYRDAGLPTPSRISSRALASLNLPCAWFDLYHCTSFDNTEFKREVYDKWKNEHNYASGWYTILKNEFAKKQKRKLEKFKARIKSHKEK